MHLIRLARFLDGGKLETSVYDIEETQFVAVSHVWGSAQWRNVEGIQGSVLVSSHKAEFITRSLPHLVGDLPFWMDVLCVDQSDPLMRKGVVGSIPDIFRFAVKTIAVRDGDGMKECCANAVGGSSSWANDSFQKLFYHFQDHLENDLVESYLNRLWTLQEILLSDVVQFTDCPPQPPPKGRPSDINIFKLDFDRINDGLLTLGQTWRSYGADEEESEWHYTDFIHAYLAGGTVLRKPRLVPKNELGFPGNLFYDFFLNSTRAATMPSDYVLVVFPQFQWYKLPSGYKLMSFVELFLDAYGQARDSGYGFIPRITSSMTQGPLAEEPWAPSPDIPEPRCLGDFLKMIGTSMGNFSLTNAAFTSPVMLGDAVCSLDLPGALSIIKQSMDHARTTWMEAHKGELSILGSWPEEDPFGKHHYFDSTDIQKETRSMFWEWYLDSALKRIDQDWVRNESKRILDLLHCSQMSLRGGPDGDEMHKSWRHYEKWLLKNDPPFYKQELLMLAAMINCLIPLSAVAWAQKVFRVVVVTFPGESKEPLLGLQSRTAMESLQPQTSWQRITTKLPNWVGMEVFGYFHWAPGSAYSAERLSKRKWPTGQDLVLVSEKSRYPSGLLPNFLYVLEENDEYTKRLTQLYCMAEKVRHDQVKIPFIRIEYVKHKNYMNFYDGMPQKMTRDELNARLNVELPQEAVESIKNSGWY